MEIWDHCDGCGPKLSSAYRSQFDDSLLSGDLCREVSDILDVRPRRHPISVFTAQYVCSSARVGTAVKLETNFGFEELCIERETIRTRLKDSLPGQEKAGYAVG